MWKHVREMRDGGKRESVLGLGQALSPQFQVSTLFLSCFLSLQLLFFYFFWLLKAHCFKNHPFTPFPLRCASFSFFKLVEWPSEALFLPLLLVINSCFLGVVRIGVLGMDLGLVGLEGLVGSEDVAPSQVAEAETKPMGLGSGLGKQGRSGSLQDDWADSKMARTDDFGPSITMSLQHGTSLLRSNSLLSDDGGPQQHMLSFSAPKSEMSFLGKDGGLVNRGAKTTAFPYYQSTPSAYNRGISGEAFFWFLG